MKRKHVVKSISFEDDIMIIVIDGEIYHFELKKVSLRLFHATAAQREYYERSPANDGIHWPLIDEDISIDGLLSTLSRTRQLTHA